MVRRSKFPCIEVCKAHGNSLSPQGNSILSFLGSLNFLRECVKTRVRLEAGSSALPRRSLGLGGGRDGAGLQEQLLVDLTGLALSGQGEQLAGDVMSARGLPWA
jgi:hypothetical protein